MGFLKWGYPIAGWFVGLFCGKSHRSKWMMPEGSPMTQDTSIYRIFPWLSIRGRLQPYTESLRYLPPILRYIMWAVAAIYHGCLLLIYWGESQSTLRLIREILWRCLRFPPATLAWAKCKRPEVHWTRFEVGKAEDITGKNASNVGDTLGTWNTKSPYITYETSKMAFRCWHDLVFFVFPCLKISPVSGPMGLWRLWFHLHVQEVPGKKR